VLINKGRKEGKKYKKKKKEKKRKGNLILCFGIISENLHLIIEQSGKKVL